MLVEEAKQKLANVFGQEESNQLLEQIASGQFDVHDLVHQTLILYHAYTAEIAHEIWAALGIDAPHVEDRLDKGITQLTRFRTHLWQYNFPEGMPLKRIEIGINHVVLYPIPTQLGRRLLACLVAMMWNPKNHHYFDVYQSFQFQSDISPLSEQERQRIDPTVSFILDHAKYQYSNPDFNYGNEPETASHLHPIQGGGYHTHFYYHWNFPGLTAIQSILNFTYQFLDNNDEEKKRFQQEIINCITTYSQHIADTLLYLLPEITDEISKPIFGKISQLIGLLHAIKDKGIYQANLESFSVEFSLKEYKELLNLMKIHNNDVSSMLAIFLFDIKSYCENATKLAINNSPLGELELASLADQETIQGLFKLVCCLNPNNPLEQLPVKVLQSKLVALQQSSDEQDKQQLDLITHTLGDKDLCQIAKIDGPDQLAALRRQFYDKLPLVKPASSCIDKEMVGYRHRVADVAKNGFTFTTAKLRANSAVEVVSRTDAKKASIAAGLETDAKQPSLQERIAADLFLQPAITLIPEGDKPTDPASDYDIAPECWPTIAATVTQNYSLMPAPKIIAVFKSQATINYAKLLTKLHLAGNTRISPISWASDDSSFEVATLKGKWFDAKTKLASSENSSHLGTLEADKDTNELVIPVHKANETNESFLAYFGAKLIKLDEDFLYDDTSVDLICAEYNFSDNDTKDNILQKKEEGVCVKTHASRQFFTPLKPSCEGGIILGKKEDNGNFSFTAIKIPYGYTLTIEPHVIHDESFFKGPYAVASNETVRTGSVLIRSANATILPVQQKAATVVAEEEVAEIDPQTLLAQEVPTTPLSKLNRFFAPGGKKDETNTGTLLIPPI